MKSIVTRLAGSRFAGKKLLFLFAIPLVAMGCNSQPSATNSNSQNSANVQTENQTQAQGRVVFSVTDASAEMQNVTSVTLMTDKLEVHSAAQGWVVVSSQPRTFDLLKLKQSGTLQVLADSQIAAGAYDQIRLHVTSVTVVKSGVSSQAKLPSDQLIIVGKVVVSQSGTASVVLDFILDKSLHLTGNGSFILTPVIKLDSKSEAQVQVKEDGSVETQEGTENDNETFGSDENGNLNANFEMDSKTKLDVTQSGAIHVEDSNKSETGLKISAEQAVQISLKAGKIDTVVSVKLETQNGKEVWHVTGTLALALTSVFVDANTGVIVMVQ